MSKIAKQLKQFVREKSVGIQKGKYKLEHALGIEIHSSYGEFENYRGNYRGNLTKRTEKTVL